MDFYIISISRSETNDLPFIIRNHFKEYICANADINELINNKPVELAYALSVIKFTSTSILPAWVSFQTLTL